VLNAVTNGLNEYLIPSNVLSVTNLIGTNLIRTKDTRLNHDNRRTCRVLAHVRPLCNMEHYGSRKQQGTHGNSLRALKLRLLASACNHPHHHRMGHQRDGGLRHVLGNVADVLHIDYHMGHKEHFEREPEQGVDC